MIFIQAIGEHVSAPLFIEANSKIWIWKIWLILFCFWKWKKRACS